MALTPKGFMDRIEAEVSKYQDIRNKLRKGTKTGLISNNWLFPSEETGTTYCYESFDVADKETEMTVAIEYAIISQDFEDAIKRASIQLRGVVLYGLQNTNVPYVTAIFGLQGSNVLDVRLNKTGEQRHSCLKEIVGGDLEQGVIKLFSEIYKKE